MAIQTWVDLSEVIFGLIVTGQSPVTRYQSELFAPPYDQGFEVWKEKGTQTALAKVIGASALSTALSAAETVAESTDVEWAKVIEQARNKYQAGIVAEKLGKRLREGRDVDATALMELSASIKSLANPESVGLGDLGDVDITNWMPFQKTGWSAIDDTVGGICAHRPTAVGGMTSVGKSMWTIQFLEHYLEYWPEAKVAVYSLEMSKEAWKFRVVNLFPKMAQWFNTGRLLVSDNAVGATDVQLEVAAVGADLVIIDYINYLVKGEITPQSLEVVNRQSNEICRTLGIPLVMLHQFNANRREPVPKESHFYMGTSSANVAGLLIGLGYLKSAEEAGEDYVYDEDRPMLMAFLKSGDGFTHVDGPGAVFLPRTKNLWGGQDWKYQTLGCREMKPKKRTAK